MGLLAKTDWTGMIPEVIGSYYTYECELLNTLPILVGEGWGVEEGTHH